MARKLENDELLEQDLNSEQKPESGSEAVPQKNGKRKVVVVNVPKKKKLLRTPSQIIRIVLILCYLVVFFLLTYPFFEVRFYITPDLQVTPNAAKAYTILAEQPEIDAAATELQAALDGLVKAPEEKTEAQTSASASEVSASSEASAKAAEQNASPSDSSSVRELDTVNYNWDYAIRNDVDATRLTDLINRVKKIDRSLYTEDSIEKLNTAVLKAQKVLCASVFISQNGLQMMIGGSVGEAFGSDINLGNTFLRGIFTFALAILPAIAVFACIFDKKRIVKNIIVIITTILVLADIFFTIYPYIGIGAVLSVTMYIIIVIINIFAFYARQQEKYIVSHPEMEAQFTEKHPHFVKALINEKSLNGTVASARKEKERESAVNAKKRSNKRKKNR